MGNTWIAALVVFFVGYTIRVLALWRVAGRCDEKHLLLVATYQGDQLAQRESSTAWSIW